MTHASWRDPGTAPAGRVTAVETFFDIVFVFTLTQLTRTLQRGLSLAGAGRMLLVFAVLWYMYGGYAWLTNHVPPRRVSQKLLLFGAMAGFFIAALGIPHAFDGTGVLFGCGYLVVIALHLILFTQADALEGVLRLAPYNLGGALLILAAGFAHGAAVYALWMTGYLVMTVLPYLVPRHSWVGAAQSFHLSAEHFVERHGLLVMIALGESVVAVGAAAGAGQVTAGTVCLVVLALALPTAIWWTYFTDDHAAEQALAAAGDEMRSLLAGRAYYFAHIPMLLGIVVAAAGIQAAVGRTGDRAAWPAAVALSGGVALFLAGVACFRWCLSIGSPMTRIAAAAAVLASIPTGALLSPPLHLALVVGIIVAMLVMDGRAASGRAEGGAYGPDDPDRR